MKSDPISLMEQYLQHLPGGIRIVIYVVLIAVIVLVAVAWLWVPFAVIITTGRFKRMMNGLGAVEATLEGIAGKLDATNRLLQEARALQATWVQDPLPMAAKGRLDRIATLIDGVAAKLDIANKELQETRKLQATQAQDSQQLGSKGRLDRMVNRLDAIGATLIALNKELQETGTGQAVQDPEPLRSDTSNNVAPPR